MWVLQIGGDLGQICKDFMTTVAIKESLKASKDDARLVHEKTVLARKISELSLTEIEAYCDRISREGEYGDHLTLIALAKRFRCRIEVVTAEVLMQHRNELSQTYLRATSKAAHIFLAQLWATWCNPHNCFNYKVCVL